MKNVMSKKIQSLTPNQVEKLESQREKWLSRIFNYELYNNHNFEKTKECVKKLYEFCGLEEPEVLLLSSPMACQMEIKKRLGIVDNSHFEPFSVYINAEDIPWLSFYEYFTDNFDFLDSNKDNFKIVLDCVMNSYTQIQMDVVCIVSKYPNKILRNENNDLHCTTGHAIEFEDGYGQHYINGRFLEKDIFNQCSSLDTARKVFLDNTNEDIKACIVTIIRENFGNAGLLKMLDAVIIDEKHVTHENSYSEIIRIYHTKDKYSFLQNSKGELNQPYAWIEFTCPSTKSVYLIDTCPTFKNAIKCAKWHRPSNIPASLQYIWNSAN